MTRAARHIVRRVVLELDSSAPPADAPRHQARVAELCRRRLAGLLDRCLAEFSDPDILYRIDRLECVIPGIDLERLESEWTEKVEARLREALQEALRRAGPNQVADAVFSSGPGARPSDGKDGVPSSASAFDLLTYFFRYGHLPWWAGATDRLAISTALQEIATTQPGSGLPERLFQMTASDTVAQQRLFRHVDDAGLLAFCRRQASGAELGTVLTEIVTAASAQGPGWLNIRTRFWMEVWAVLQMPGTWQERLETLLKILSADEVGGVPWSRMVVRLAEKYRFLSPFASGGVTSKGSAVNRSSPDDVLRQSEVSEALRDKTKTKPFAPDTSATPQPGSPYSQKTDRLESVKEGGQFASALPISSRPPEFDASDQIYLENAGLVLLAPFLPRLWEQLGWTTDKQFTDPETAWLAVQMLQFLADGQDEPPEYLMILPKILCGLAPDALYAPPRALEAAEKAEGEALLAAVLELAPGLGLTTTGALRGSFLLRNGVLRSGGMHWLLHVEKETYDIVLQKVPWGFQVLKFPWMEVAVFVEWEV